MNPDRHFVRAVKAVTAFLVLRRSMTGSPAGIASDFQRIMSPGVGPDGNPLCLGLEMTNRIFLTLTSSRMACVRCSQLSDSVFPTKALG